MLSIVDRLNFIRYGSYKITIIFCLFLSLLILFLFGISIFYYKKRVKDSDTSDKVVLRRKSFTELKYINFIIMTLIFCLILAALITVFKFKFSTLAILASTLMIISAFIIKKVFFYFVFDFLTNDKLKFFGVSLIASPIISVFLVRSLAIIRVPNVEGFNAWKVLGILDILFTFVGLVLSVYCLYKGIEECIVNPYILYKPSLKKTNREKIKILVTWFILLFINSVSILYFFSKLFPGSFLDIAVNAPNGGEPSLYSLAYFTIITLLTIGYGDITPRGVGRAAVSIISLVGAFYMIIAIASIISSNTEDKKDV